MTTFMGVAWAIFKKDLRTELRARYALFGTATFAIATLAVVSSAVGPFGGQAPLLAAFLWTVLLFSASAGLAQAFGREVERKTWLTLRLVAPPGPLLLGKWGVNLVLLFATEALVVPLFLAVFGVEPKSPLGFLAVLVLATIGLSASVTWVAALVAQARSHAALVAALAFPLVVPVVKTAIEGTRHAITEPGFATVELRVLTSFAGAIVVGGFLLAEHVLDD